MNEEQLREKYFELQMTAEQVKQMQQQLAQIEAKLMEMDSHVLSLAEMKGNPKAEILAPIVDGIFVKTRLLEEDKVIINVGAGVCVEKKIDDAIALMKEKQSEVRLAAAELQSETQSGKQALEKLEKEFGQLINTRENV